MEVKGGGGGGEERGANQRRWEEFGSFHPHM